MPEKFPLTNKFLMCQSYACLKKLADFFPTILTSTEKNDNYIVCPTGK